MSSICIPRVESTISKEYIYNTLMNLQIGNIEKIIEIPLRNDPTHKRIIIKLNWNKNSSSLNMQKILRTLGSVKLVYDMPWYWKIVEASNHPQK